MTKVILTLFLAFGLAACGTRSSSSVSPVTGSSASAKPVALPAKPVTEVIVTENDIADRRYRSIGDVEVTVSKWTIFDADPTREKVNEALKEKAAALGADAVILVRYGTVGMGVFTWGKLEGSGRAIVFER
jgi:ABC-type Fe3+-hydroxamate transport system substrate-binding protein